MKQEQPWNPSPPGRETYTITKKTLGENSVYIEINLSRAAVETAVEGAGQITAWSECRKALYHRFPKQCGHYRTLVLHGFGDKQ
jgi:hypothetical protein